jgi:hypothetical protein
VNAGQGTKSEDALLEQILRMRPPGGEDFFIFSLVIDDPATPTWELRTSFVGSYEQSATLCVGELGLLVDSGCIGKDARIELYQGEAARRFIASGAAEEAGYLDERRNQPNN